MSADEKRVREFAYQIWESEGQPHGHDARHWEMARKLAEAEALAPDKTSARKASKPRLPKVDGAADAQPASKPAAKAPAAGKPEPAAKAPVKAAPKPAKTKAAAAPVADKPEATPAAVSKPAVKRPRKPAAP